MLDVMTLVSIAGKGWSSLAAPALLAGAPAHALVISRTNSVDSVGPLDRAKDVNVTIDFMKCQEGTSALTTPSPALPAAHRRMR